MADYVNKQVIELNKVIGENENRATRRVKTETHLSDGRTRLYKLAAVCFGMMCILQVILNISLKLAFCTGRVVEERDMAVPTRTVLGCAEGWSLSGSSCYFLSTERKIWEESRQDCLERGADLVVVNSRNEQKFLTELNRNINGVWIGLTDRETEGTWKWVDGTPLTTRYWGQNQPDNGAVFVVYIGEEDCVEINYGNLDPVNKWNDIACNLQFNWICERVI
ncbi:CD209 antigen-like protein D [Salmo salar]|uniref:CD209 antigen-like protein D n=1 Tax=Salmo salar TaxID=8030 RepID=B5XAH4_SALSA|nr:CD209 antigen-like protein D [Salmo salar]ACI67844.1 CD209 antigen-like protein D [Salmo salar]|eukprot:NP_001134518.1 CD209 antigen-like protein D [Salmo salar]